MVGTEDLNRLLREHGQEIIDRTVATLEARLGPGFAAMRARARARAEPTEEEIMASIDDVLRPGEPTDEELHEMYEGAIVALLAEAPPTHTRKKTMSSTSESTTQLLSGRQALVILRMPPDKDGFLSLYTHRTGGLADQVDGEVKWWGYKRLWIPCDDTAMFERDTKTGKMKFLDPADAKFVRKIRRRRFWPRNGVAVVAVGFGTTRTGKGRLLHLWPIRPYHMFEGDTLTVTGIDTSALMDPASRVSKKP